MKIQELSERSRAIFRQIVETYLNTGEPVGSRTVSRQPGIELSPASVRNVMADLEEAGLLSAPHTSAGRMPTQLGLRLFVDGLLEVGNLTAEERSSIEAQCAGTDRSLEQMLTETTTALSGLSHCAGLVLVPKADAPLKHVEFVSISQQQALAVLVLDDDQVENRIVDLPPGLPAAALTQAANYLNARFTGVTVTAAHRRLEAEASQMQRELDSLTQKVVEAGLATWTGERSEQSALIVRGRANLLDDVHAVEDLERIRRLFDDLENKRDLIRLLELARDGDGVRIFIGAENNLFSLSGSSLVVSPYMNGASQIVGVVGVIGPTRLNYARIIPMVDYTAKLIGQIL